MFVLEKCKIVNKLVCYCICCMCVKSFMGSCLHESAVDMYWKFLIVVFQGLKHCLCLMWVLLTSTRSGNVDSMIKLVKDVCWVIKRALSLHHHVEHHQLSFSWQVPYLVWIDIQYYRKVSRSIVGMWFWALQATCKPISCECYVLSGRDVCIGLITCPEKSYQVWCV